MNNEEHILIEKINDLELRSEDVQEILTRVPSWMIRRGSVFFLLLILGVLFLSWMIRYPDILMSEAIITTQVPPQKEYAKVSGTITAMLVNNGDTVQPRASLAVIENTANYQDVLVLQTVIDTVKIDKEDFRFPFDKLPILFLGEMESQFATLENTYRNYRLNKELHPFDNQKINDSLIASETKMRLKGLLSKQKTSQSELRFKKKELVRYKKLYTKGVISEQEYETKQLNYLSAKKATSDIKIAISQLKEGVGNATKQLQETRINSTREETQLFKQTIQSYLQLKKALKDWQQKYVLQSNINGKVSFMKVWSKNQYVNNGDLVFTIIPTENSSYLAKLKTPVQNSGKIKIGQDVNIKLANYPDTEFGMLKGSLSHIALIPDIEGYYTIDVALPTNLITTYNKIIPFKQEMPATAEIITEDLRLIERFFYQFREVFKR